MKVAFRLGVFRDLAVFQEVLPADAAVVVPAHIAAYALDGLRGFLSSLAQARSSQTVDFVFDPMTYWLDLPTRYWTRGSGKQQGQELVLPLAPDVKLKDVLRPTLHALLRDYGLDHALYETDRLGMRQRLAGVVDKCLAFQRRGTHTRRDRVRTKYKRILELLAEEEALEPAALVAPYVKIADLSLDELATQAALNETALSQRQHGERLWTVAALGAGANLRALSQAERTALRLEDFDAVGVWVSDFDEYVEPVDNLRAYRRLLSSVGRPIWIMYGTYFALLLGATGVDTVSHGIYYTESKRMEGPVGSGPPPERYYVPALHRFYEPTKAFRLIDLRPGLACPCPECTSLEKLRSEASAASTSPAKRVAWAQRLQRHFLRARSEELRRVRESTADDLRRELRRARQAVESIPPTERSALGISTQHLDAWYEALAD
jgi:hypothetical protein